MNQVGVEQPKQNLIALWQVISTVLSLALAVGVSWTASWYIASGLNQSSFHVADWVVMSIQYRNTAPELVSDTLLIVAVGFCIVIGIYLFIRVALRRRARPISNLHGSARWADKDDIVSTGLLPQREASGGVYVGGWMDGRQLRYLRHDGPEHVLVMAPTRSGKGVGLVIPTLLSWAESAIIHDPKGEVWAITSGWRQHAGHKVIRFDPTLPYPQSARFNPLREIRLGTAHEVADAQNLSTIIADPEGKGLDDHWSKTAQAFLTGVILHVCYVGKNELDRPATLSGVAATLSDPKRGSEELLQEMTTYPHLDNSATHETVAQEARTMMNREERELSSVWSTAVSFLSLYRDPGVAAATDDSDFAVADLMHADAPVSLYLVVRPSDAARLRPLVRMMLTQIIRSLTGDMQFEGGRAVASYKHRLLFMLDEFPSLKRLPAIEDALPYMAGYGLKAYLITQDSNQLINAYGSNESITSNCHVRVAFAPNRLETAKMLSEMTGDQTVIHHQLSASGGVNDMALKNVSQSVQEVRRPLLTPEEVRRLPAPQKKEGGGDITSPGDMLIFVAGHRPIYGRQILYFTDPVFKARSEVEPPARTDVVNWF